MIVVTSDDIAGKEIQEVFGLVRGSTVRARHIGRDIMAGLRSIVGGEVKEYTRLMAESRQIAIDRMIEQANDKGANGIVGTRLITAGIMNGASEIMAYGTAVLLKK